MFRLNRLEEAGMGACDWEARMRKSPFPGVLLGFACLLSFFLLLGLRGAPPTRLALVVPRIFKLFAGPGISWLAVNKIGRTRSAERGIVVGRPGTDRAYTPGRAGRRGGWLSARPTARTLPAPERGVASRWLMARVPSPPYPPFYLVPYWWPHQESTAGRTKPHSARALTSLPSPRER